MQADPHAKMLKRNMVNERVDLWHACGVCIGVVTQSDAPAASEMTLWGEAGLLPFWCEHPLVVSGVICCMYVCASATAAS